MAKTFPRRTIALGPPYDDGTVPGKEGPADALGATQPSNGSWSAVVPGATVGNGARSANGPTSKYKHPDDEKREVIAGIRHRLPLVAIGHPDLAEAISQAMDAVESERPAPKLLATEMAEVTAYLWGLVLAFHAPGHGSRPATCKHWYCGPIRHAVIRQRDALVAAGHPDPMVENFKPEHRP